MSPDQDHAAHLGAHKSHLKARSGTLSRQEADLLGEHLEAHSRILDDPSWKRRTASRYPGGWRFIQVAGETLLYDGPTPNGSPYLPIAFVRNYEDPGFFWGLSEAADMEPMQYALNQVMSQILDLVRFGAHRPLLVDTAQNISEEQLVAQVGLLLWVNREKGVPPVEWAPALQLDPSWLNYAQTLARAMLEQAGLSEIVEGGLPGSGLSGNALAVIKEASLTRTQKRAASFEDAWRDAMLALVAQVRARDREAVTIKAKGTQWQANPTAVPSSMEPDSYYITLNGAGPSGGRVNDMQRVALSDLGIKVSASGTMAKGKAQRRNELVGLYKDSVIGPRALRQMLVGLDVFSPQEGAMIEAEFSEMMAAKAGPQAPPGAQPPPAESEPPESGPVAA